MRLVPVIVLCVAAACSTFDSIEPNYQQANDWGSIEVWIRTEGLDQFDRNVYAVVMDSALQGFANRPSEGGIDSVTIEPVLPGRHLLQLRDVSSYCEVQDGRDRDFIMYPSTRLVFLYVVTCVYPSGD